MEVLELGHSDAKIQQIRRQLLAWYKAHKRDLPWRHTRDPYKILVSEVMLQQTQVSRVLEKYREWLGAFPTVQDLAQASPADVLIAWKGLGYNRRAMFLKKTAEAVVFQYGGVFPAELTALKSLPGVGDYTARAILSFAFEQAVPMMDTNHRRFYQRVYVGNELKKDKELLEIAENVFSKRKAYDWNQALMDFGSLICQSKKPQCASCPLQKQCKAYPEILAIDPKQKKTSANKKRIPFRDTDRFIRGKILDALREGTQPSVQEMCSSLERFSEERMAQVFAGLVQDGLIILRKNRACFPE